MKATYRIRLTDLMVVRLRTEECDFCSKIGCRNNHRFGRLAVCRNPCVIGHSYTLHIIQLLLWKRQFLRKHVFKYTWYIGLQYRRRGAFLSVLLHDHYGPLLMICRPIPCISTGNNRIYIIIMQTR